MKTQTSPRKSAHLDYELLINEVFADSGTISISNIFKIPQDIEQAVNSIKKTAKIDEIQTPLKKVSQSLSQVIEKNRIIASGEIIPPTIKKGFHKK